MLGCCERRWIQVATVDPRSRSSRWDRRCWPFAVSASACESLVQVVWCSYTGLVLRQRGCERTATPLIRRLFLRRPTLAIAHHTTTEIHHYCTITKTRCTNTASLQSGEILSLWLFWLSLPFLSILHQGQTTGPIYTLYGNWHANGSTHVKTETGNRIPIWRPSVFRIRKSFYLSRR